MNKTQKENKKPKPATPSRRSVILKLLQEQEWTKEALASKLQELNKGWAVERNKSAISGVLSDLRRKPQLQKKQRWIVQVSEKGAVSLKPTAASTKPSTQ